MLTAKQYEDWCQEALAQPQHTECRPFLDSGSTAATQEPHLGSEQGQHIVQREALGATVFDKQDLFKSQISVKFQNAMPKTDLSLNPHPSNQNQQFVLRPIINNQQQQPRSYRRDFRPIDTTRQEIQRRQQEIERSIHTESDINQNQLNNLHQAMATNRRDMRKMRIAASVNDMETGRLSPTVAVVANPCITCVGCLVAPGGERSALLSFVGGGGIGAPNSGREKRDQMRNGLREESIRQISAVLQEASVMMNGLSNRALTGQFPDNVRTIA
ncbi:hypothetical protein NM208_g14475 [Fusarium decemcellulare]|uniref:Uncharacterized protein n=1 Tax=Fusarium decemcellulare TaxID=57161 RepID=A0ACC1RFX0_9HYPO|nr:hypothetical protein NM208_g14475 [Fusarium decemcellulare]